MLQESTHVKFIQKVCQWNHMSSYGNDMMIYGFKDCELNVGQGGERTIKF